MASQGLHHDDPTRSCKLIAGSIARGVMGLYGLTWESCRWQGDRRAIAEYAGRQQPLWGCDVRANMRRLEQ